MSQTLSASTPVTYSHRATRFACLVACFLLWQQPFSVHADPPPSDQPAEVSDQATPAKAVELQVATADLAADSTVAYSDYFRAYEAAATEQKDLLLYCFDPQNPSEAQVEFEAETLHAPEIRDAMDDRFLLVRIATDSPIQTQTTVRKTRYVRSGFRRIPKTWNQVVNRDLFAGKTSRPGVMVVQVTDAGATSDPTIIAHFPFQSQTLSPHIYAVDTEFKPWERDVFCSLVSTPVTSAQLYLDEFCSKQSMDSSCVQREFSGKIESLDYVYYDYAYTGENLRHDEVTTRLHIAKNAQLAAFDEPIAVRVDAYSLRDSSAPAQYAYAQVEPSDDWQTVTVQGLQAETPYRMCVYFYTPGRSHQLIGEAVLPLHAVTSGQDKVAQARAAIATKALSEVNDWRRGSYDRRKGYVVGRWCERFYCWNILSHLKTPYRDSYSSTVFSRHGALFSGRTMRNMVQNNNVMGDHIRTSNHGFMVLSYDKHLGQVWTIEGNYNNSVVLTRRYLSDYWSLGTIVESMLIEQAQES